MEQQVGVFMTPEYLERFAETVSERVYAKIVDKFQRDDEPTLDVEQAAAHLKMSRDHLYRLTQAGIIPGHKKPGLGWKFYRSELNDYVRSK